MTDLREQIAQAFHEATKDNLVEFQSFETGYEAGWQAARATAEQSTEATVPYSLYVAGCRDFERVAARCDDAAEIIGALQKALSYWMPKVFDERSAHDAYLLMGYNGEDEPAFWDTHQSRDSVIEECAMIVEQHQETFTTMSGGEEERHLTTRRHGNQMGMAYANAIRALKSQQDADIESKPAEQSVPVLPTHGSFHTGVLVKLLLDSAFEILRPDSPEDCPEEPWMRVTLGKKYWAILTATPRSIESQRSGDGS